MNQEDGQPIHPSPDISENEEEIIASDDVDENEAIEGDYDSESDCQECYGAMRNILKVDATTLLPISRAKDCHEYWLLEEFQHGYTVPEKHEEAKEVIWLTRSSDAQLEVVPWTNLIIEDPDASEDEDGNHREGSGQLDRLDQIYRLSFCESATAEPDGGTKPMPANVDLQPGESKDIGTEVLYDDSPRIRVWKFQLELQERCNFYRHTRPYFFLNLTESLTQELDKSGRDVTVGVPAQPASAMGPAVPARIDTIHRRRQTKGQCTMVVADSLSAHAVRNVGESVFQQFVVEFF